VLVQGQQDRMSRGAGEGRNTGAACQLSTPAWQHANSGACGAAASLVQLARQVPDAVIINTVKAAVTHPWPLALAPHSPLRHSLPAHLLLSALPVWLTPPADVWANPVSYDKLGVRYRRWRNSGRWGWGWGQARMPTEHASRPLASHALRARPAQPLSSRRSLLSYFCSQPPSQNGTLPPTPPAHIPHPHPPACSGCW